MRTSFPHSVLPLKSQRDSSQQIALTDEHISMLERRAAKFRGADPKDREKIVTAAADHIEKNWRGDVEFHRDTVISVCDLSAQLGIFSHISSLFANVCMAALNGDRGHLFLSSENGHTLMS